jgi:RNA recognition motif-containing protein
MLPINEKEKQSDYDSNLYVDQSESSFRSNIKSPAKLFVTQLPAEVDEDEIIKLFRNFGEVINVRLVTENRNQSHKG